MIEYGIACGIVVLLSLANRDALPWAILLLCGWVAGFAGHAFWPYISLSICLVTLFWFLDKPTQWKAGVHAVADVMFALDVWYLWQLNQGVYAGVEYANALTLGLIVQLALVGWQGVGNVLVRTRSVPNLRRRSRRRYARSLPKQSTGG
jgi:hypothetical protein